MQFRLTYTGRLLSYRDDGAAIRARAKHKHEIRKEFHKQLKALWYTHPNLEFRTKNQFDQPIELEERATDAISVSR